MGKKEDAEKVDKADRKVGPNNPYARARHANDDVVRPEDCPQPRVHGNPFRFCPYCSWIEEGAEAGPTVPDFVHKVLKVDSVLEYGPDTQSLIPGSEPKEVENPRANDPAMEQSESNEAGGPADSYTEPQQVGINAEPTELSELEHPTVEYGGPRIEASPELNYADLPEENYGPRPTYASDDEAESSPLYEALQEETVMESNDGDEGMATSDTRVVSFDLGEYATLKKDDQTELVLERLKEIETALLKKKLRKFEIEIMQAIESDEYAQVTDEVNTFTALQLAYVQAFQNQ